MLALYLGRQPYLQTLALQEAIFNLKVSSKAAARQQEHGSSPPPPSIPDVLLLVEHEAPVYTMGRRDTSVGLKGGGMNVTVGPPGPGRRTGSEETTITPSSSTATMSAGETSVVKLKRGGGLTWHGPGQVTMYPVVDVQRLWQQCRQPMAVKGKSPLTWFTKVLETTMIKTCGEWDVVAEDGLVGVWVDPRKNLTLASSNVANKSDMDVKKIGSIGLQVSKWISMHGIGFNVQNDLSYFESIVMCELPDKRPTSLLEELRRINPGCGDTTSLSMPRIAGQLACNFVDALERSDATTSASGVPSSNQEEGRPYLTWCRDEVELRARLGVL